MSRLYHNETLRNLPVKTNHVDFNWDPDQYRSSGPGVILEGEIEERSRHMIISNKQKCQYYVLHIKCTKAHTRRFDPNGKEIEPNFSETQKVRQGYLHSSYKTVPKGETDQLTSDQLTAILSCPSVDNLLSSHDQAHTMALWIEETRLAAIDLSTGDRIRAKTQANCPFIESISKLDAQTSTVSNYAGGNQVGDSWTDKIMAAKSDVTQPLPQDMIEGVDDDEWDD